MSEEQLTVEKIQSFVDYCDSMSHVEYVMADAPPEHNDVMSHSHMELHKFLLSQLATIERDTAEKCAEIANTQDELTECSCYHGAGCQGGNHGTHADAILHHFNLGEKP